MEATILKIPVLIVGAGPAGCSASYELTNNHIQHIVIDHQVFPRDKICGDALSGKVIDVLSKVRPEFLKEFSEKKNVFNECHGIRFFGPNLKSVSIPFPEVEWPLAPGYVAKRGEFDKLMFDYLDVNYATIYQGISSLKFEGSNKASFKVGEKVFEVSFDLVLGADGARSKTAEHFVGRFSNKEHHSSAVRAYYKNVTGFQENYIELHFIKDLLPGYFWVFPLPNNEANIGLGMLTDKIVSNNVNVRKKLLEVVATHPVLKERFKNAELIGGLKGWGLPLGSVKRKLSGNNFMLLGDAAWLIDPFTGEGIGNAILSGKIAAKWAVKSIESSDYSAALLKKYDHEVYDQLEDELKLSYRMQKLSSIKWLFNLLINKATGSKELQKTMTLMYTNLEMRAKLKSPWFYIKMFLGY